MENSNLKIPQNNQLRLKRLKKLLLISVGIFVLRYLILIIYVIWNDKAIINGIPILFITQIILAIIGFTMFCYGLFGIKEYLVLEKAQKIMKNVVITLLTMILLLIIIVFTWTITSFIPITETFPFELWIESLIIAIPFAELIPLTLAMMILSYGFWLLKEENGWKTMQLITPFLLLPLTIIRIITAILKIINIIDPIKFQFSWKLADFSRIIYAVLGIILFTELLIQVMKIKPKIIIGI